MPYNEIKNLYHSKYSFALKTFKECAHSDDCPDFIENLTICFKYDKILKEKKSVDSLYFCDREQLLYFIEFKNSYFGNYIDGIVEKAIESLLNHHNFCAQNSINNSSEILSNMVSVFSSAKSDLRLRTNTESLYCYLYTLLKNAKYGETNEGRKMFDKLIRSKYEDQCKEKCIALSDVHYDNFEIVFSDDFDSFVSRVSH